MVLIARAVLASSLILLVTVACGSRTGLVEESAASGTTLPKNCGNGECGAGEDCLNCSIDCGLCAGCGDNTCSKESGETCTSCPTDCGVCEACGDGFCKGDENCVTCAPDCGKCASCGDGSCDAKTENCFTCPDDCGACQGCGDGVCRNQETCASCIADCGVCAVCGNKKCEEPYETCTNCHQDCGDCEPIGCLPMLSCSIGCIDQSSNPPNVRVSCVGDCVAKGCPAARYLFDQAFNCFLQHVDECGINFGCLQKACDAQVGACIGAQCR